MILEVKVPGTIQEIYEILIYLSYNKIIIALMKTAFVILQKYGRNY